MARTAIPDLLPGTLGLLILRTLDSQPLHGWAISERIQHISEDVLQVNQGSLYPALHRLEHQGLIEAEWSISELGRRAKYYRLTAPGRRRLSVEAKEWERMAAGYRPRHEVRLSAYDPPRSATASACIAHAAPR